MSELRYLPVDRLHPHPDNPRKELGDLTELADSIRANGIYQNLTVVYTDPNSDTLDYTVIIGHRRLAAAKLAGLTEVPCVLTEMDQKEQVQTMLLENMQRSDLTVYEQAQGFQMMLDLGASVNEIAEKAGFSKKTVRSRLEIARLDPGKLKEASTRQVTISDFDELAKIEDISERNKVLESIGTREFQYKLNAALRKQKEKRNLPLVKKWLKAVNAEKLNDSDAYSAKYESYDGRYSIDISEWGEGHNKPPEIKTTPIYYVLDKYGSLRLYKKREKAKAEKKSPSEIARTKAVNEAWNQLDKAADIAYGLRKQFMEKLIVSGANRGELMYGAFVAALLEAIDYNGPDRDYLDKAFNINTNGYDSERGRKLAAGLENLDSKKIPMLVYALFGDNVKVMCVESTYHGDFPKYKLNIKMNLLYDWLSELGYEMSTEEMQLLNGEHEVYHQQTEVMGK